MSERAVRLGRVSLLCILLGLVLAALLVPVGASSLVPEKSPRVGSVRQVDWKPVAGGFSPAGGSNRIVYARRLAQGEDLKGWLPKGAGEVVVRQDYSHTGLLAIYLTSGFSVERVYADSDGSLNVQVHLSPTVFEDCVAGCIRRPPIPSYSVLAVRKGSLPAPVRKLYIREVSDPDIGRVYD